MSDQGQSYYDQALEVLRGLTTDQLLERAMKSDARLRHGRGTQEHDALVEVLAGVVSMILDGPLPPGVNPGGLVSERTGE